MAKGMIKLKVLRGDAHTRLSRWTLSPMTSVLRNSQAEGDFTHASRGGGPERILEPCVCKPSNTKPAHSPQELEAAGT